MRETTREVTRGTTMRCIRCGATREGNQQLGLTPCECGERHVTFGDGLLMDPQTGLRWHGHCPACDGLYSMWPDPSQGREMITCRLCGYRMGDDLYIRTHGRAYAHGRSRSRWIDRRVTVRLRRS